MNSPVNKDLNITTSYGLARNHVSTELNKLGTPLDKASTEQLRDVLSTFKSRFEKLSSLIDSLNSNDAERSLETVTKDQTKAQGELDQLKLDITFVEKKIAKKLPDIMPILNQDESRVFKSKVTQDDLKSAIQQMRNENQGMDKQVEKNGIKKLIFDYLNIKLGEGVFTLKSSADQLTKLKNSNKLDGDTKQVVGELQQERPNDPLTEGVFTDQVKSGTLNNELKAIDNDKNMDKELINDRKKDLIKKYLNARVAKRGSWKTINYAFAKLLNKNSKLSENDKQLVTELKKEMVELAKAGVEKYNDTKTKLTEENKANVKKLETLRSQFETKHAGKKEQVLKIFKSMEDQQTTINLYKNRPQNDDFGSNRLTEAENNLQNLEDQLNKLNEEDNYKNDEDEINKLQEEINNFAEDLDNKLKKTKSANYEKFQRKFLLNNYSVDLLGKDDFETMRY